MCVAMLAFLRNLLSKELDGISSLGNSILNTNRVKECNTTERGDHCGFFESRRNLLYAVASVRLSACR